MKNIVEDTQGLDRMPKEVATEMLLTKKRITNKERKMYSAARWKLFKSSLVQKPREEKLNQRLQRATWAQLAVWLRRSVNRRADCQRAYLMTQKVISKLPADMKERTPAQQIYFTILQRQQAVLDLRATALEQFRDAIESEIARRREIQHFQQALRGVQGEPGTGI